jgi:hypothetical protein
MIACVLMVSALGAALIGLRSRALAAETRL